MLDRYPLGDDAISAFVRRPVPGKCGSDRVQRERGDKREGEPAPIRFRP